MRLVRNSGCLLHLVEPLGFTLDDARLRRAGLDYADQSNCRVHRDWQAYMDAFPQARRLAFSTRGRQPYHQVAFQPDDHLLFGPETRGLPDSILTALPAAQRLRLPMVPDNRSLNLSNAVAIALYEAWRQLDFAGAVQ